MFDPRVSARGMMLGGSYGVYNRLSLKSLVTSVNSAPMRFFGWMAVSDFLSYLSQKL